MLLLGWLVAVTTVGVYPATPPTPAPRVHTMATTTTTTNATTTKGKGKGKGKGNATPTTDNGAGITGPVTTPTTDNGAGITGQRIVAATAKAAAGVAAGVAKRGAHQLTPNQTATLAAMRSAGAVDAGAAISHNQIASLTGRTKGNQLRQLAAAGLVVQLAVPGTMGYRFYLT